MCCSRYHIGKIAGFEGSNRVSIKWYVYNGYRGLNNNATPPEDHFGPWVKQIAAGKGQRQVAGIVGKKDIVYTFKDMTKAKKLRQFDHSVIVHLLGSRSRSVVVNDNKCDDDDVDDDDESSEESEEEECDDDDHDHCDEEEEDGEWEVEEEDLDDDDDDEDSDDDNNLLLHHHRKTSASKKRKRA